MNKHDWSGLPYFLAVARQGSLRGAAEDLGATHTTVDRNIKALEASYGALLFKRTTRGYALTEAGEALLPRAKAAEAEVLAARRRVSGSNRDASGIVRLSTSNWLAEYLIAPSLEKFSKEFPEIDLKISISDQFLDLSKEDIDVSLRVAFDVEQDIVARRLFSYDVSVFAAREYLDRHWLNSSSDGEGLHWIGWDGPKIERFWHEANLFPRAAVRHSVDDGALLGRLISQGLGMGIYPFIIEHIHPNVVQVPGAPIKPDRSIWILLHSDFRRIKRVRAVVDFIADEMIAQKSKFQGPYY